MSLPQHSDPPIYRATPPQPASTYTDFLPTPDPFDRARYIDDYSRPLYRASFPQAIRRFWKNYARFSGRASRSEFWWATLMLGVMAAVPAIILAVGLGTFLLGALGLSQDHLAIGAVLAAVGSGLGLVVAILTLVPTLALGWRRVHDANLAGPAYLLAVIPSSITTVLSIAAPGITGTTSNWGSYSVYFGAALVLVFGLLKPKSEGRRFDVTR